MIIMKHSYLQSTKSHRSLQSPPIWILFLVALSFALAPNFAMSDDDDDDDHVVHDPDETNDYIVFTDQPPQGQDLRDYALQILTPVLGSEQAAEEALIYIYRNVGPGFCARLTPEQALQLQNQPGVVYVKESEISQPDIGDA